MGWLDAVPELEISGQKTKWKRSRLNQFRHEGKEPPLPDFNEMEGAYLIKALYRAGPIGFDPMSGSRPLSWSDIHYFNLCLDVTSTPWERDLLYDLAQAYYMGYVDGGNALNSIPPLERVEDD